MFYIIVVLLFISLYMGSSHGFNHGNLTLDHYNETYTNHFKDFSHQDIITKFNLTHFVQNTSEHVFVSGFFDLGGFRDSRKSYIDAIPKIFANFKPMIFFCENIACNELAEEAEAHNVYLVHFELKNSKVYTTYKDNTTIAIEHIREIAQGSSSLIQLGKGIVDYILITHVKFELLHKGGKINPFNSTYMSWVDAGLYRHFNLLKTYNPNGVNCYHTQTTRLATGNPKEGWPSFHTSVMLIGARHEVAGGIMTFNIEHFHKLFYHRYFSYLNEIYNQNLTTTEQGLLSLYVQRYSKEVDFVNCGYADIGKKMLNC